MDVERNDPLHEGFTMSKKTKTNARPIQMKDDATETMPASPETMPTETMNIGDVVIDVPAAPVSPAPVSLSSFLANARANAPKGTGTRGKGRPRKNVAILVPGMSMPNSIALRSFAADLYASRTWDADNGTTFLDAGETRWNHTTPLSTRDAEKGRKGNSPRFYAGCVRIHHLEGETGCRAIEILPSARETLASLNVAIAPLTPEMREERDAYVKETYTTSNLHDARADDDSPRRCARFLTRGEIVAAIARNTLVSE